MLAAITNLGTVVGQLEECRGTSDSTALSKVRTTLLPPQVGDLLGVTVEELGKVLERSATPYTMSPASSSSSTPLGSNTSSSLPSRTSSSLPSRASSPGPPASLGSLHQVWCPWCRYSPCFSRSPRLWSWTT